MKWVLIVAGALVALVLIVVVIGSLLPVRHVASRAARFHQPPEAVWAAITDVDAFPTWRSGVTRVERLADTSGHVRWIEDAGGERITFETVQADAPRRLVVRIADPSLPFGGSWTYEITPIPDGARLGITENGEVYNPIFRFMARFVFGHTATIEQYLTSLGTRFGERVTPSEA